MERHLVWFCLLAWTMGGCYPERASSTSELAVRIPIAELGVEDSHLEGLRRHLAQRIDGIQATFDLGQAGSNFYLGLLFSPAQGQPLPAVSGLTSLSVTKNANGFIEEMQVSLRVSPCLGCEIAGVVFWARDGLRVQTFSGSAPCDVSEEPSSCAMVLDEQPTGSVMAKAAGGQPGLVLACMDLQEAVRFPRATEQSGAAGAYLAEQIPLDRPFVLQIEKGQDFIDVAPFTLTVEGERRTLDFDPDSL